MRDYCLCGGEHEPYQCLFLDFGPCDLFTEDEGKIWIGTLALGGKADNKVQLLQFETASGEVGGDFNLTADEALRLAELLTNAASQIKAKAPAELAISRKDVERFHAQQKRRKERLAAELAKLEGGEA